MLSDTSPMPFGKHAGLCMIEVPGSYLIWLWNENVVTWENEPETLSPWTRQVMEYIEDNLDAIKEEAGQHGR